MYMINLMFYKNKNRRNSKKPVIDENEAKVV